jgi:hypothetical protein
LSTQFLGDKKALAAQEDRVEAAELEVEGLVEAVRVSPPFLFATWRKTANVEKRWHI